MSESSDNSLLAQPNLSNTKQISNLELTRWARSRRRVCFLPQVPAHMKLTAIPGTSGQAKNFITRTQAVRKLQITLPDFRRLCIFKGIYPREPRNKKKAAKNSSQATTFYYTKDIQYLLHEPLLNKFREHKTLAKKISRALGRGEVGDASRLEKTQTPRITLDHIIKERYPTFVDALRDLDDALSMLFLFANLPSTSTIPPKTIALCQRLCLEFQHYIIVSHSLRKTFLSIKGIYYQATIQGQDILWLVPYKFVQRVTGDIDFRIMGTFIEFYTTLLGFVNFRLYTSAGLIYPPKFNAKSDEQGAELGAFTLEGRDINTPLLTNGNAAEADQEATARAQAAANSLTTSENPTTDSTDPAGEDNEPNDAEPTTSTNIIDTFTSTDPTADTLLQPAAGATVAATLFAPFTFYLSRETPRQPLEFLLKAFGSKRVGWDAVLGDGHYTSNELDTNITHQIVDRPPQVAQPDDIESTEDASAQPVRGGRVPGRIYVQPQWVWDCINQGKLLRPDLYAPGATLPPHLSPWVRATKGTYDPTVPLETDGVEAMEDVDDGKDENVVGGVESVKAIADLNGADDSNDGEMDVDEGDEDDEDDEDEADEDSDAEELNNDAPPATTDVDDFGGFSGDEEQDEEASSHQRELEAEAAGVAPSATTKPTTGKATSKAQKEKIKAQKEKDEAVERAKMMMPRRKRKLLEKMQYSNAKKEGEKDKLESKRRKLEKAGKR